MSLFRKTVSPSIEIFNDPVSFGPSHLANRTQPSTSRSSFEVLWQSSFHLLSLGCLRPDIPATDLLVISPPIGLSSEGHAPDVKIKLSQPFVIHESKHSRKYSAAYTASASGFISYDCYPVITSRRVGFFTS